VISLQSEIKRHEAEQNIKREGEVLLVKSTDFIVLLPRKEKNRIGYVCAYLIQVSELHIHFRRITMSTHIPNINTPCCIRHCPRCMFITDIDFRQYKSYRSQTYEIQHNINYAQYTFFMHSLICFQ